MSDHILRGIVASQGITIGKAYVYRGDEILVPRYHIPASWVDDELRRFDQTVTKTKNDIAAIRDSLEANLSHDMAEIFGSHLLVLEDPQVIEKAREKIISDRKNSEWVINDISLELMESLAGIKDDYIRERIIDIADINKRLIANLQKNDASSLNTITEEVILIAHDLTPSETATMNRNLVKAFVTDKGGKTSHTAIMARAFALPAIIGAQEATSVIKNGDTVIIDAIHGEITVNPSAQEIEKYHEYLNAFRNLMTELDELRDLPARTRDGVDIEIMGNIEIPDEMNAISEHRADGIGLFRSEFLFLDRSIPSEEDQYAEYRKVAEHFYPRKVTIRTLDVGGDKIFTATGSARERNPFLGCRAIRFSLENEDLFATQLRAILRASAPGNISLMFPMITTVEELIRAREMTRTIIGQLENEGVACDRDIPMGIMIEVPSAAYSIDILAPYADFFSVGTNDLVQYLLAVDRISERIAYLYNPLNPAVLRTLRQITHEAEKAGKPVSICGEVAGDYRYTMILLGLGFRKLSMSPSYMYQVKKIIRSVTIEECVELAERLLGMNMTGDIEHHMVTVMQKKFPEICY